MHLDLECVDIFLKDQLDTRNNRDFGGGIINSGVDGVSDAI